MDEDIEDIEDIKINQKDYINHIKETIFNTYPEIFNVSQNRLKINDTLNFLHEFDNNEDNIKVILRNQNTHQQEEILRKINGTQVSELYLMDIVKQHMDINNIIDNTNIPNIIENDKKIIDKYDNLFNKMFKIIGTVEIIKKYFKEFSKLYENDDYKHTYDLLSEINSFVDTIEDQYISLINNINDINVSRQYKSFLFLLSRYKINSKIDINQFDNEQYNIFFEDIKREIEGKKYNNQNIIGKINEVEIMIKEHKKIKSDIDLLKNAQENILGIMVVFSKKKDSLEKLLLKKTQENDRLSKSMVGSMDNEIDLINKELIEVVEKYKLLDSKKEIIMNDEKELEISFEIKYDVINVNLEAIIDMMKKNKIIDNKYINFENKLLQYNLILNIKPMIKYNIEYYDRQLVMISKFKTTKIKLLNTIVENIKSNGQIKMDENKKRISIEIERSNMQYFDDYISREIYNNNIDIKNKFDKIEIQIDSINKMYMIFIKRILTSINCLSEFLLRDNKFDYNIFSKNDIINQTKIIDEFTDIKQNKDKLYDSLIYNEIYEIDDKIDKKDGNVNELDDLIYKEFNNIKRKDYISILFGGIEKLSNKNILKKINSYKNNFVINDIDFMFLLLSFINDCIIVSNDIINNRISILSKYKKIIASHSDSYILSILYGIKTPIITYQDLQFFVGGKLKRTEVERNELTSCIKREICEETNLLIDDNQHNKINNEKLEINRSSVYYYITNCNNLKECFTNDIVINNDGDDPHERIQTIIYFDKDKINSLEKIIDVKANVPEKEGILGYVLLPIKYFIDTLHDFVFYKLTGNKNNNILSVIKHENIKHIMTHIDVNNIFNIFNEKNINLIYNISTNSGNTTFIEKIDYIYNIIHKRKERIKRENRIFVSIIYLIYAILHGYPYDDILCALLYNTIEISKDEIDLKNICIIAQKIMERLSIYLYNIKDSNTSYNEVQKNIILIKNISNISRLLQFLYFNKRIIIDKTLINNDTLIYNILNIDSIDFDHEACLCENKINKINNITLYLLNIENKLLDFIIMDINKKIGIRKGSKNKSAQSNKSVQLNKLIDKIRIKKILNHIIQYGITYFIKKKEMEDINEEIKLLTIDIEKKGLEDNKTELVKLIRNYKDLIENYDIKKKEYDIIVSNIGIYERIYENDISAEMIGGNKKMNNIEYYKHKINKYIQKIKYLKIYYLL